MISRLEACPHSPPTSTPHQANFPPRTPLQVGTPLTRSQNNVGRWNEKSVGKGISFLLPRTSCLLSKRSFLFIFERPSLIAILSLLQTDTVTMLHLSGVQLPNQHKSSKVMKMIIGLFTVPVPLQIKMI